MVRIVHITKDDKFLDNLIVALDLDNRTQNEYFIVDKNEKPIEKVKQKDRVRSITYKALRLLLRNGNYDVVYFHSINESAWVIINWIPKNKIIIWWAWGYDLYVQRMPFFKPLIDIPLYKVETEKYTDNYGDSSERKGWFDALLSFFKSQYFQYCRNRNIKRIDYFFPVIPLEQEYLKSIHGFHARPFSNPRNTLKWAFSYNTGTIVKPVIFLGNSATPSNNHLDVWRKLSNVGVKGAKVIIPLSYGSAEYRAFVTKSIQSVDNEIIYLHDFISFEQYDGLIKKCQYALLGVLRQQADGNVSLYIKHGIKMFFYEDSMMYRHLKSIGCYVYSIDKLTKEELEKPLSLEQAEHNYKSWYDFRQREGETYNLAMNEILIKTKSDK